MVGELGHLLPHSKLLRFGSYRVQIHIVFGLVFVTSLHAAEYRELSLTCLVYYCVKEGWLTILCLVFVLQVCFYCASKFYSIISSYFRPGLFCFPFGSSAPLLVKYVFVVTDEELFPIDKQCTGRLKSLTEQVEATPRSGLHKQQKTPSS